MDWEIASSIRDTQRNSRTGLLGILLPPYSDQPLSEVNIKRTEDGKLLYNPYAHLPPRLHDNVECGYAKIYSWPSSPEDLKTWIHEAFQRRKSVIPDNSYPGFANNRSESQSQWSY
uniref:Uncharacterized protein n=1 Tax=Candidatus Kentrum sp. DK TaxID=2126562 RepID=A0A450TQC1_9GAMM|nr:MAG: hypothetical protein BECKDK2373B_GA0170837_12722 [Candidatus Kentron sp. DK]